ncbi:MAG: YbgC/FadM family acyl-CoA thioesterase [Elusimicrobiota bacterium]
MSEKHILIIDDDQTLVDALKEGMESLGFKVGAAYDGLQGILQAHQDKPDVIMLDFNMPAGGGAGVYERLRCSVDTGKIPIIFLTGVTVAEVKRKIRSTPNTYFLKKPVSVSQLRKVLDKIIGGKGGNSKAKSSSAAPTMPRRAKTDAPFAGVSSPQSVPAADPPSRPIAAKEPPPAPAPAGSPTPWKGPPTGSSNTRPAASAPAGAGRHHEFEVRVTYADTDRLGIIYYANYFKYFELGRTELMRTLGIRYRDLEMERKLFLPAVEARCEYLGPSHYDDLLIVRTWLSWLGPASVCFQNEIYDKENGNKLVARGFSRHAMVNEFWKPARIPKDLKEKLNPFLKR